MLIRAHQGASPRSRKPPIIAFEKPDAIRKKANVEAGALKYQGQVYTSTPAVKREAEEDWGKTP